MSENNFKVIGDEVTSSSDWKKAGTVGVFVRTASQNDVTQLALLEERLWIPELRASKEEIQARIETFPEGQLLLVSDDGNILLGVLYTQRLHDIAEAQASNGFQSIRDVFDPNGSVWQLMAIAVDTQLSPTGAQLLRATILENARKEANKGRLHRLVAVSRCSNFHGKSEDEYVSYALSGQDPTLFFHLSGGAKLVNLVRDYRTVDMMNYGYGVLVEYSLLSSSVKDHQATKAIAYQPNCITDTKNDAKTTIFSIDINDICKEMATLSGVDIPSPGDKRVWSTKPFLHILDSLKLQQLHHWLEEKSERILSPDFLFQFSSAEKVIKYFSSRTSNDNDKPTLTAPSLGIIKKAEDEPIAIVGIGMRLPCGIHSLDRLWECMASKTSCSSKVPSTRWYANSKEFPLHSAAATFGCFVENEDYFDPSFFGLNDSETEQMDPHHRMLLECVARAVYDSGKRLPDLADKNIGVWVGGSTSDFPEVPGRGYKDNNSTYAATSVALSMAAGRISYLLGLHAPSMTIDTACSSSLVAIDLACMSLRIGNCEEAIVAAVNLILAPWISNAYSRAGMLSPTGECKSFDASADGYCRGEGGGALLLKPLSKAIADGDNIHGLIRSSSVMHHGKGASLTAPNSKVQEALLRSALSKARITSSDVFALEAHGTGTKLGDPVEVAAVARVFGAEKALLINCVKANVGHLEAAAGMAGIFASLAYMKYGQLPGQAHLYTLNENIEKAKQASKLIFPTECTDLNDQKTDGRGALLWSVNSFGYSGTIANVILEQYSVGCGDSSQQKCHHQLGVQAFNCDYKPRRFPYGPDFSIVNNPVQRVKSTCLAAVDRNNDVVLDNRHQQRSSRFSLGFITSANEVDFARRFGESVLNDHVVHSELILAGACMIDIVCAIVLLSIETITSGVINLIGIFLNKKIVFDDVVPSSGKLGYRRGMLRNNKVSGSNTDSCELFVHPDITAAPSAVACFTCKSAIFSGNEEKKAINNKASALFAGTNGSEGSNNFIVSAPNLLYTAFAERGLQFGKSFCLLKQDIWVSTDDNTSTMSVISSTAIHDKKNDGVLQLVNNGSCDNNLYFIASPQLIDALFQLCGFTMFSTCGEKYPHLLVPFSIGQVIVRTLLYTEASAMLEEGMLKLQLKVHVKSEIARGAIFDGQILLPNGDVLVSLTDIMLRTMQVTPTPTASSLHTKKVTAEKSSFEEVEAEEEEESQNVSLINIASDVFVPASFEDYAIISCTDTKKKTLFQVISVDKQGISSQTLLSEAFASIQASASHDTSDCVNNCTASVVKVVLLTSSLPTTSTSISDFIGYLRVNLMTSSKGTSGVIMMVSNKLTHQQHAGQGAAIFAALKCAKVEFDLPFAKLFELESDMDIAAYAPLIVNKMKSFANNNEVHYRLISPHGNGTGNVLRMQPQIILLPQSAYTELQLSARGSLSKLNIKTSFVASDNNKLLHEEEVYIQVIGNSLNFRDVLNVLGMYPGDPGDPGCEFSGIILAIGTRVTKLAVGDTVIGLKTGCLRSRLVIHQNLIVKAPSTIPLAIASVLPVVYTTVEKAFQGFLSSRDVVLIHTAAGGVGFAALQYAKKIGAKIITTASRGKHDILRKEEGIEYIFDSRNAAEFRKEIKDVIAVTGMVTFVLNTLNGDYINASLEVLAPHGRFVELGKRGIMTKDEAKRHRPDIDYEVIAIDDMAENQPVEYIKLLKAVTRKFDAGFWSMPRRFHLFSFAQFKEAFQLLRDGKNLGKVVLYHSTPDAISTLPSNLLQSSSSSYSSEGINKTLSAVIVTGGTGSLGILTIKALLKMKYAKQVFVLSRRASDKRAEVLQKLPENCSSYIHFVNCDVGNQDQVDNTLKTIRSAGHAIEGVVHAAGIVRDGLIINGNAEKGCTDVWNSKFQAAVNLSNSTKDDNLKIFVMFSSIIGLIGRHGQSAYAAANSALDQLAELRSRNSLPATSIRWPAIANTGMTSGSSVDHRGWSIEGDDFTAALMVILKSITNFASSPVLTVFPSSITSTLDASRAALFELCACDKIVATKTTAIVAIKKENNVAAAASNNSNSMFAALQSLDERLAETVRDVAKKYTSIPLLPNHDNISLTELGVDSLAATEFSNELGKALDLSLSPTLVFSYPTVQEIAAKVRLELESSSKTSLEKRFPPPHQQASKITIGEESSSIDESRMINKNRKQQQKEQEEEAAQQQRIKYCSIIGMACRFPKGIHSLQQLSHAMFTKQVLVGKAPASRGFDEILSKIEYLRKRKSQVETVQYGGFLDDAAMNDFSVASMLGNNSNMTEFELQRMDLRQKLALKMAIEAVQDAGIDPFSLQGRKVGVFVGALGHLHTKVSYLSSSTATTSATEKPSVFDATTNSHSVISGRISYLLGLEGPAMTIDTACSSSLVALHTARRALEADDCEMALVIGVNVIELDLSLAFATAGMLSADGQCRTFDESANGYCRGEGCGALLLTRQTSLDASSLAISSSNKHRVYAIIKGSAVMQDGKSANLTAPNGLAQERLLCGALHDAGLSPDDVQFIEAHGTGTKLGDPIEIESLRNVYLKSSRAQKNNPLYVSSSKANLGHMEAAAGMAGLFAVVACLREQRVYPNAALQKLNPHIQNILSSSVADDRRNIVFPQAAASLFKPVLHAAVSSFGYSGTIAHVILGSPGSEQQFEALGRRSITHHTSSVDDTAKIIEAPTRALSLLNAKDQPNEIILDESRRTSEPHNNNIFLAASMTNSVSSFDESSQQSVSKLTIEGVATREAASTAVSVLKGDIKEDPAFVSTADYVVDNETENVGKPKDYHDKIKTIKAIIKTVLVASSSSTFEEIDETSNLVDLGLLDSLTATELSNHLSDEFDLNMSLSVGVILDNPTIHGIVSAVLAASHEIENVFASAIAEQNALAKNTFSNNSWFLNYFVPKTGSNVEPAGRLLVFGGMAHPAASWNVFVQPLVAMGFHVHIVRLPGRFERFSESAALDVEAAIGGLCSTLNCLGWLSDTLPLAVMGYSFGATMAYETVRMLQHHAEYKDKFNVCQLILLAGPDRSMLATWEFPALEDRTLASFVNYHVKHMGRMNPHFDTDAAYLPKLLGFILEVFFRDVQLLHAWMMHFDQLKAEDRQVKCNLLCINGTKDMAVQQRNNWLDIVTTGKYEQISFPGDHFFVYHDAGLDKEVAEQMGKAIKRSLGKW